MTRSETFADGLQRLPAPLERCLLLCAAVLLFSSSAVAQEEGSYKRSGRSLADLMKVDHTPGRFVPGAAPSKVDEAKAAQEGIRKIAGRRLVLYTDLPPDPLIDELPKVFEEAFPLWCAYFGVEPQRYPDWHMTGFLMQDADCFRRAGMLPPSLPPFLNGYSVNYDLWLYEQPTPYYRRHLLLHEGTHGFMNTILRSCGPPWYMEGIAELFGTHRWENGQLAMRVMPKTRNEAPGWGRVKIIQDEVAVENTLSFDDVLRFSGTDHRQNEAYAWSWAAAILLDSHPRYQTRFRTLGAAVEANDFTERFRQLIGEDWNTLAAEWQVMAANMEYGYDVAKMALDMTPGSPLEPDWKILKLSATKGWQNTGIRLESGAAYDIRAQGRYQVAKEPVIWWCEPGGVTIRYYRGRPLGILLAAVAADNGEDGGMTFAQPTPVGLGATLAPQSSGTLFLRINDSPAELDDNQGALDVAVRKTP